MKLAPSPYELISNMRSFFQNNISTLSYQNEELLRSELYSTDQMEKLGKMLASSHKLYTKKTKDHLLKRLADNETVLNSVRKLLTDGIKKKYQISPAGEWLIDNFYLIEENIRSLKIHFPQNYSEDLPHLIENSNNGIARIYDITLKVIAHSDGRVDIENLSAFLNAYQAKTSLKLGELWALPIMLRIALIENLRRLASRIALDRIDINLAIYWSEQMIEISEKDPKNLILTIADMARSKPPMVESFVAELIRQLSGKGPVLALAINWIEQQLAENGLTSTELVNAEIQKQAFNQVSISNTISSLRLLDSIDWKTFIESNSIVEQILCKDFSNVYASMDFSTRDHYRHIIERIAKKGKVEEKTVAEIVVELANNNHEFKKDDGRNAHIGYYLLDDGLVETYKKINSKELGNSSTRSAIQKRRLRLYFNSIFFLTLILTIAILFVAKNETQNELVLILIGFLALIGASQMVISLVNFISTLLVKPLLLPRMDFSSQIPDDCKTLVIVPSMLSNIDDIEELVDALEVRFLANRNENLHFGLLTDFTDAQQETLPNDAQLINTVKTKIEELNLKYQKENADLFFLFHRPRKWNPKENSWMGYERKRGKIEALNAVLRGGATDSFSLIIGNQSIFPNIKYVITLDSDTHLPMGSAWKLVGTIAHPLNRAWYDEQKKRITKGYGIIQPRVTISLPDETASWYARMHGNEPGIDPYTRASSDVYQDLFYEGSFIGKGIYDVDVFKNTLENKFAENTILSHDLLEGCYVRSGLVSDVQLFEKYPTQYRADMKRRARWIRGDWQIFSWFLPRVQNKDGKKEQNPLSLLSRWKIFDNIRRSLVPIALTTMLLLGWFLLSSALLWTLIVTGIIILPIIFATIWTTIRKPKDVIISHHLRNSVHNLFDISYKTLFSLVCLPFESYVNFTSIARSIWRMLISKRHLLEWNPSGIENKTSKNNKRTSYKVMWIEPFLSLVVLALLIGIKPTNLTLVTPFAILWFLAPFITWWMSKPFLKQLSLLTANQNIFLRKTARKTWSFFEHFVVAGENWLPPDNYQEQPIENIAHRTSPTNIGLSLLASFTAYEFGYLSANAMVERVSNTLDTMKKMERYRGHFYNWYDTISLNPLFPKYISTVDSGNLAGHLLVLKQGLLSLQNENIIKHKLFEGIEDTLLVLEETLAKNDIAILKPFKDELQIVCKADLNKPEEVKLSLQKLNELYTSINDKLNNDTESLTNEWNTKLKLQLQQMAEVLDVFNPWFMLKEAPSKFKEIGPIIHNTNLVALLFAARKLLIEIKNETKTENSKEEIEWLELFETEVRKSIQVAEERITNAENLANTCNQLSQVYWDFLFDKSRSLLTIGYNVNERRMDASFYDLLASEARLGIFIGIAQGKLPEESWFSLGRLLTNVDGKPALLSWSGSMFEYLMPLLVMPNFENTLLDQTCKSAVDWQIKYGAKLGKPWGISESGFNMTNVDSNYQYRAFGAPGLGLKRGLEEDYVIAPYATAMALMVAPEKACSNLENLNEKGFEGKYGFYEAIDYTPSRNSSDNDCTIIYSFMAHHQGMSLLSFAYLLLDKPMQKLFELEPQFKATLLLLQERIPRATTYFAHTTDIAEINYISSTIETRIINTPNTPIPEVQLLSNGNYHVMITNSGGGYSRWKDIAVTRWREDVTCDNWGTFFYIRDLKKNTFWSPTKQPSLQNTDKYEVAFSQGRVDFRSLKNEVDTHIEIVVSPEDDIELRRIHLTNSSSSRMSLEFTSYSEIVLASQASDMMAPAFSNLFVQTEINPNQHAILCTRRPRSADENPPYMFQMMSMNSGKVKEISFETDRMEFIGRDNTIANPIAIKNGGALSGNQGAVLDPIAAISYRIVIEPDEKITFDLIIGITDNRESCHHLIEKYQDKHQRDRVFELSWTHSQVILRQINASEGDAQLFGKLSNSVIYPNATYRADPTVLIHNHKGQSGLWAYSISGDLPIVLLRVENQGNIQLVKQLIQAHSYWRLKGLAVDLVIWNEEHNVYRQDFHDDIQALIPPELNDTKGGVYIRSTDQISNEDRILFQSVARIIIDDNGSSLADFINQKPSAKFIIPFLESNQKNTLDIIFETKQKNIQDLTPIILPENLVFYNGIGGFSTAGDEYILTIDSNKKSPAPWVNVIANPTFGTVISESGAAYTWFENAHEFRLTPWNNDPITDSSGEAYYIRDEENGYFWSTTLLPSCGATPYITRHGFGYSKFEHLEDGIYTEMLVFVDIEAAIKFIVIKAKNQSGRNRKLSATGYIEWVLGDTRSKTGMHIRTEVDPDTGALFAKNPYSTEFSNRIAFFDADYTNKSFTSDRTEFIGRNGSLQKPEALLRQKLSGKVGLALDPCAAIQVPFNLLDGEEKEIIFRLGAGIEIAELTNTIRQFRGNETANDSFEKVIKYWKQTLGTLKIETPDSAINIIANGWLNYQTLSSRLWGRSGFYQSGGAYGFRDQLQDVLSLLHTTPNIARNQILLSASRQFKEGDVQHWWHPPRGQGVRSRCSDDFLWLPLVTAEYVSYTGDTTILDENVHYLEGRVLNSDEESYYDLPLQSYSSANIYDHCVLAIKNGFKFGKNGIPLIGTGDWNDGYDKVGDKGKGESVWLGFFLYDILIKFAAIATVRNDTNFATECTEQAENLKANIDKNAWDGEWYKRAWMDDGTALGSSKNVECSIDSIAQSWSVISEAGEKNRTIQAMESAYQNLVKKDIGIIQLLNPPFDKSDLNPGYIKGYLPGVRENGGQYTHAAVWMIMAFAKLGNNEKVWELLNMINPINHGNTSEKIRTYKVEPYVLAADVYENPSHAGRGGWTWYTGSAGWLYRLIIENFLGLKKTGNQLIINPCIPKDWTNFKVEYQYENNVYFIEILQENQQAKPTLYIDGLESKEDFIILKNDGVNHFIKLII